MAIKGRTYKKVTTRPLDNNVRIIRRSLRNKLIVPCNETTTNASSDSDVFFSPLESFPSTNAEIKSSTSNESIITNIDQDVITYPEYVSEYANNIYKYLLEQESSFYTIGDYYTTSQPYLTTDMRLTLVEWLIEIQTEFGLRQDTLFLGVNIMDRYTFKEHNIAREKYQLVGATSLWIASKFEEITAPMAEDFVRKFVDFHTIEQFFELEKNIMHKLGFRMNAPLSCHFLRRVSHCMESDNIIHNMAKYIIELCLIDYNMSTSFYPSMLASSASFIAHKVQQQVPWNNTATHYMGITYDTLQPCVLQMSQMLTKIHKSKHPNVYSKYTHNSLYNASLILHKHIEAYIGN